MRAHDVATAEIPPRRRGKSAVSDAQIFVDDNLFQVDFVAEAQPAAFGTSPVRIIERKQSGFQFFDADVAIGTAVFRAVNRRLFCVFDDDKSVCEFERGFDAVRQTSFRAFFYGDTVDCHRNIVFYVFVKDDFFVKGIVDAVHTHADVAGLFEVFKFLSVFALSASDDGCHDYDLIVARLHGAFDDFVGNLVNRLMFDFPAALRTMRSADAGVQKP